MKGWVVDDSASAIYARAAQRLGDRAHSPREVQAATAGVTSSQASPRARVPRQPRARRAFSFRRAAAGR